MAAVACTETGLARCSQGSTPTAQSRSTSAGSVSPGSIQDGNTYNTSSLSQLPNYEYPTPFIVKNTFIDIVVDRSCSLDEFLAERRVHSCPVEVQPELISQEPQTMVAAPLCTTSAATLAVDHAAYMASAAVTAVRGWWGPAPYTSMPSHGPTDSEVTTMPLNTSESQSMPQAQVLSLADAIVGPELGSAEVPTMGSMGHHLGSCKPCAFFHKGGCGNGVQCPFCHLCDAGEKKRRQKDKVAMIRQARNF